MSKNLPRAIGLINGLLHIETMEDFNKEVLVAVLKEIKEILTQMGVSDEHIGDVSCRPKIKLNKNPQQPEEDCELENATEAWNTTGVNEVERALKELNEQAYYEAISKYPKGIKAHSFYPYEPCKCCSDPKAYAEYMSKPKPEMDNEEQSQDYMKECMKEERVEPVNIWRDVRGILESDRRCRFHIMKLPANVARILWAVLESGEKMQKDIEELKRK